MGVTVDDYLAQLQALLPPGAAWTREADAILTKLLTALADELARVDGRADDLVDQLDPRTSNEMLTDWETILGLPDVCADALSTIQERRAAAYATLTATGGASRLYFINLAAALGYEISITEYFRFTAGSPTGAPLTNDDDWRHTWRVNGGTTFRSFTAGSQAGEPIRAWGNALLECAIAMRKPAHTKTIFSYVEEAPAVTFGGEAVTFGGQTVTFGAEG